MSSNMAYANPTGNPYIVTSPAPPGPIDMTSEYLTRWGKKAQQGAGSIWQHLKTGPNMADTAWGKLSQGTKLVMEGGAGKIFRQTFETSSDEKLLKYYACYLSTSLGPIAGTLYISTKRIAFGSDRPLSYEASPGQTSWNYYKVVVPLDKLQSVNASSNPNNPAEKYIQILTSDNHEFWVLGFVNYDKAVKNLQEAQLQRR